MNCADGNVCALFKFFYFWYKKNNKKDLDNSVIPHNNLYDDLVALMTFACR